MGNDLDKKLPNAPRVHTAPLAAVRTKTAFSSFQQTQRFEQQTPVTDHSRIMCW